MNGKRPGTNVSLIQKLEELQGHLRVITEGSYALNLEETSYLVDAEASIELCVDSLKANPPTWKELLEGKETVADRRVKVFFRSCGRH